MIAVAIFILAIGIFSLNSGDVTIGEAASDSYTTEEYAKMYYSLKLKVVAATTGTTQPGV